MFGGLLWVLAVVAMWATIFILSLTFARAVADSHDQEMASLLASPLDQDSAMSSEPTLEAASA